MCGPATGDLLLLCETCGDANSAGYRDRFNSCVNKHARYAAIVADVSAPSARHARWGGPYACPAGYRVPNMCWTWGNAISSTCVALSVSQRELQKTVRVLEAIGSHVQAQVMLAEESSSWRAGWSEAILTDELRKHLNPIVCAIPAP